MRHLGDPATDKVILVTGATDGIGKATARRLAELGATVLLHGRNARKLAEVEQEILSEVPQSRTDTLVADFNSLDEVRALAIETRKRHPDLNVLVNNAGIFSRDRTLSRDGHEQTLQINYLAPFLLTEFLVDTLLANGTRANPARVVNVTSVLHKEAPLDFANLEGERDYSGYDAYGTSKLLLAMFTVELAERLRAKPLAVNCVHPGGVDTKLLRAGFMSGGISPERGADGPVYLATSADLATVSGAYFERSLLGFGESIREGNPDPRVLDRELRGKAWDESVRRLHRAKKRDSAA